jgi:hypothetical protein
MIGQTKRIRRALMAVLRPLTGDRATGQVLAKAAVGTTTIKLPKGSYCLPAPASVAGKTQLSQELLLHTTAETVVTEAGTLVPITSTLGGVRHNLAAGTVVRWDPPLLGMVPTAAVHANMTGGLDASGPGMVRQVLAYETLIGGQPTLDVFLAKIRATPAVVVAWASSQAVESTGVGAHRNEDLWKLYVVCSISSGASERGDEALDILDAIESYLTDRSSVDGWVFSGPAVEIRSKEAVRLTSTSAIYSVTLMTSNGVRRTEHRTLGDSYEEWLTTQIDLETATTTPLPVVIAAIYPMESE